MTKPLNKNCAHGIARIAKANEELLMKNPEVKFRWTAENINKFVSDKEIEELGYKRN